jgi:hypothetical protein
MAPDPELKYHWVALKNDDSEIEQFVDSVETLFSAVMTQLATDNVKEFRIEEQEEASPKAYLIDLVNYKFYQGTVSNPKQTDITPVGISGSGRADLVFKRRNQVRVNETGQIIDPSRTTYILGLFIGGKAWNMDIRAKVGQLPEQVVDPRETNESHW